MGRHKIPQKTGPKPKPKIAIPDPPFGTKEACAFLGIGMTKLKELIHDRPYDFPVAQNGRKYLFDRAKLSEWRDRWYNGDFII